MAKKKIAEDEGKKRVRRAKGDKVVSVDAPATRTKKGKKSKDEDAGAGFNPYAHLGVEIDAMEKKFGLMSMAVSESEDRLSTGLLSVDTVLAGGLLPGGWYTFFGGEQSCKSTMATTAMGSIATNATFNGIGAMFDYEGCICEDSVIITRNGPVPLRDILPRELPKEGEAYPLDVEVESVDGMQVSQFVFNKGVKPITKITTKGGRWLRGFAHPVLIRRGDRLGWELIENLVEGDLLVVKNVTQNVA